MKFGMEPSDLLQGMYYCQNLTYFNVNFCCQTKNFRENVKIDLCRVKNPVYFRPPVGP